MPYAENIIEFINSLSDQELKDSRVVDRFYFFIKFINFIEKGEFLKALVKKIEEDHQVIIKFKTQFRKVRKLGLPSP